MRVFAGLFLFAAGAVAASAMPPAEDALGNSMALKDSPSIAGRPDAEARAAPSGVDLSEGRPELIAIMDRIETTQRMPRGSAPIAAYARFYAWADVQKTKVTAVYLRAETPGRRWVDFDDLPMSLDGGCRVVELVYDVKTGVIDDIYCHGAG